eukprot:14073574-Heterocapsa_arctica.AAC.1
MIKEDVKDENNELRHYVDDMALFKEGDTEEQAIRSSSRSDRGQTKADRDWADAHDKKEQILVQSKTGERVWHQTSPDYKGRVGQANSHTQASLNKAKRVDDTVKAVRQIQSLALSVKDKVNIIKAAGQSRATYGAA